MGQRIFSVRYKCMTDDKLNLLYFRQAKMFDEQMAALLQEAGVQNIPSSGDTSQGLSRMAG